MQYDSHNFAYVSGYNAAQLDLPPVLELRGNTAERSSKVSTTPELLPIPNFGDKHHAALRRIDPLLFDILVGKMVGCSAILLSDLLLVTRNARVTG